MEVELLVDVTGNIDDFGREEKLELFDIPLEVRAVVNVLAKGAPLLVFVVFCPPPTGENDELVIAGLLEALTSVVVEEAVVVGGDEVDEEELPRVGTSGESSLNDK